MPSTPETTDRANVEYWNELCGTNLANHLGIKDASERSLKKFDDWFFSFYPYLFIHIPFDELKGKDVLEVGLGYGTVAQRLAENGARYTGLDIASGPVEMARHRLSQAGLPGEAQQGSILTAPFSDDSFDAIVTIGCLHHTGDLAKAIDECHRILRPGGKIILMLYYAYSYRRWMQARKETLRYLLREQLGYSGVVQPRSELEKWDYDHNTDGQAAPHTDFVSIRSLKKMCKNFSSFEYRVENINIEPPFQRWKSRRDLLKTLYPRMIGLDIYATAAK
ncbi:MAG: class I SAM-dependent methyltransferase [Rhizobiales bacterium]|nr:class I SAM-dependent methyltransferase [Hyphomicrobiales bacterium]